MSGSVHLWVKPVLLSADQLFLVRCEPVTSNQATENEQLRRRFTFTQHELTLCGEGGKVVRFGCACRIE
jgi:hypothetical protein